MRIYIYIYISICIYTYIHKYTRIYTQKHVYSDRLTRRTSISPLARWGLLDFIRAFVLLLLLLAVLLLLRLCLCRLLLLLRLLLQFLQCALLDLNLGPPQLSVHRWTSSSLKRRVRSQLARWVMKNCTPLWREAHVEVKMYKTPQLRTTFGNWDVEKVHAAVARSTFPSQNVQSTPFSDHFWKFRCRTSARRCGAKHISKSKWKKHLSSGPLLEVALSKKCTRLWRRAHFEVKMYKASHFRATFGGSYVVLHGRCKGLCTFSKVSKTWGLCSMSKNHSRRGTFEEDLQRCILRGRRSTKDIFVRAVRRSGYWFPERGGILERQICRFAEMILRDRCSTSYDLASVFRGRRSTLERGTGKFAKRIGTRLSGLHLTFNFWRRPRRIALVLMLSCSNIGEVSQNCFVLDVAKFKNQDVSQNFSFLMLSTSKVRKSGRIASFLMLSTLKK